MTFQQPCLGRTPVGRMMIDVTLCYLRDVDHNSNLESNKTFRVFGELQINKNYLNKFLMRSSEKVNAC